jgi:hypothetical protein
MRSVNTVGQWFKSGTTFALAFAIATAVGTMSISDSAEAQYRSTQARASSSANSQRYVSRTTRRIAVPTRNQRVYSAPRGATLLRSRAWDPRTRWLVDSRTHSTYAVLSNGEVWFLEPSSGWAYTVDRYGRVYGADPRRNSVYAFSSLHSWRGDMFYFFDYFSPYDGYYTVRDYDWFYSSYYGRRYSLFDYGYAYSSMWNTFDDFWFSNRFRRSVHFRYYEPAYIRYDAGWNSRYYYNSLPAVYIAPCYSYTVVNNTVVVNNNYYTNVNNTTIVNNNGTRSLPSAEQAAVQLSQQVAAPAVFAGNAISEQQLVDVGLSAPQEQVKEIAPEQAFVATAEEPLVQVPGVPEVDSTIAVAEQTAPVEPSTNSQVDPMDQKPAMEQKPADVPVETPIETPIAAEVDNTKAEQEEIQPLPAEPVAEQGFSEPTREQTAAQEQMVDQQPEYQEPVREEPAFEKEPAYEEPAREEQTYDQPAYEEPAFEKEPAYEEPAYQEPAREEPAFEKEPAYEEPAYQEPAREEQSYEQPAYEEPAYQEPAREEQSYEQPAYEEPAYQEPAREEQSYEQPAYQEPAYEQPAYQEPAREEQSYVQPAYQEPAYEQPAYQEPARQEQSYEQPSYQEPARQEIEQPAYEQPKPDEGISG